jgi:hypothetical protein
MIAVVAVVVVLAAFSNSNLGWICDVVKVLGRIHEFGHQIPHQCFFMFFVQLENFAWLSLQFFFFFLFEIFLDCWCGLILSLRAVVLASTKAHAFVYCQ